MSLKLKKIKSLSVFIVAFKQLYFRILMGLFVRGVYFPGAKKIKKHLPQDALATIQRRSLVREIKQQRYSTRRGPLWFREIIQKTLIFINRNRVWATIVIKLAIAILVVFLVGGAFFVIRGVLPVPERIAESVVNVRLSPLSNIRTDWLYTEPETPKGFQEIEVGNLPKKQIVLKGFKLQNGQRIDLFRQKSISIDIAEQNQLRILYYLFPNANSISQVCRLRVFDENENLLLTNEQAPPLNSSTSSNKISYWLERFSPTIENDAAGVQEFVIDSSFPPGRISFTLESIPNTAICNAAIGDISFESHRVQPLKRRGLLLLLVNGLRFDTSQNEKVMKNLKHFSDESLNFINHYAASNYSTINEKAIAMSSISSNKELKSLASTLREEGYRTAAFGSLSPFRKKEKNTNLLGFNDIIATETPQYETRQTTEEIGKWLEQYGEAPFFIQAFYNTMQLPFRPPFQHISISRFLKSLFTFGIPYELYRGLAVYWDEEFGFLKKRLADLGIGSEVDIAVSSLSGTLFDRSKGELSENKLHVPFIFYLSNSKSKGIIREYSSHFDVMPSIESLFVRGPQPRISEKGGIDWFANQKEIINKSLVEDLLSRRNFLFSEDKNSYSMQVFQNPENEMVRYTLTHSEADVEKVFLKNEENKERPITYLNSKNLHQLRDLFFKNIHAPLTLELLPSFSGHVSLQIEFLPINKNASVTVASHTLLRTEIQKSTSAILLKINGSAVAGDALKLKLLDVKINSLISEREVDWGACALGFLTTAETIMKLFNNRDACFFQNFLSDNIVKNYQSHPLFFVSGNVAWPEDVLDVPK